MREKNFCDGTHVVLLCKCKALCKPVRTCCNKFFFRNFLKYAKVAMTKLLRKSL